MKTESTDPAMPTLEWGHRGYGEMGWITINGLTKREHFAAMAMQGLLSNHFDQDISIIYTAELAVKQADALIEALNK